MPSLSNAEQKVNTPPVDSDKNLTINKNAAIAGGAAAGATVVGAGALATTASAATLTSTIAAVGAGSMAVGIGVVAFVPIAVGGAVYVIWSWIDDDEK